MSKYTCLRMKSPTIKCPCVRSLREATYFPFNPSCYEAEVHCIPVDPAPIVGASTSMADVLADKDARIAKLEEQVRDGVTYGMLMKSREMVADLQAENAALSRMVDALCFELFSHTNELTERDWREWAQKQANQGTN